MRRITLNLATLVVITGLTVSSVLGETGIKAKHDAADTEPSEVRKVDAGHAGKSGQSAQAGTDDKAGPSPEPMHQQRCWN